MELRTLVPINRKRFIVGFFVSNVVLFGVVAGVASAGVGTVVPVGGVGTFTITFDELQGEGFEQRSTIERGSGCEQYPVSVAQIDRGTIRGLHLFKDVAVPASGDSFRVSITADSAEYYGLDQQFTNLKGDIAFDGEQTAEYDSSGAEDQLRITASRVTIEDGRISTDNQFITQLSLGDLTVDVERNPDDGGPDLPEPTCLSRNGTAA